MDRAVENRPGLHRSPPPPPFLWGLTATARQPPSLQYRPPHTSCRPLPPRGLAPMQTTPQGAAPPRPLPNRFRQVPPTCVRRSCKYVHVHPLPPGHAQAPKPHRLPGVRRTPPSASLTSPPLGNYARCWPEKHVEPLDALLLYTPKRYPPDFDSRLILPPRRSPSPQGPHPPAPQNEWEVKRRISRLRLEMTGVSPALQAPTPPPLKADALPLPPLGRGAPRGGRLRGLCRFLPPLSLWPLHRRALAPPESGERMG